VQTSILVRKLSEVVVGDPVLAHDIAELILRRISFRHRKNPLVFDDPRVTAVGLAPPQRDHLRVLLTDCLKGCPRIAHAGEYVSGVHHEGKPWGILVARESRRSRFSWYANIRS
jgi:hypothetical protein